ncbi:unnamed protein product [Choristocarpus tenellus]
MAMLSFQESAESTVKSSTPAVSEKQCVEKVPETTSRVPMSPPTSPVHVAAVDGGELGTARGVEVAVREEASHADEGGGEGEANRLTMKLPAPEKLGRGRKRCPNCRALVKSAVKQCSTCNFQFRSSIAAARMRYSPRADAPQDENLITERRHTKPSMRLQEHQMYIKAEAAMHHSGGHHYHGQHHNKRKNVTPSVSSSSSTAEQRSDQKQDGVVSDGVVVDGGSNLSGLSTHVEPNRLVNGGKGGVSGGHHPCVGGGSDDEGHQETKKWKSTSHASRGAGLSRIGMETSCGLGRKLEGMVGKGVANLLTKGVRVGADLVPCTSSVVPKRSHKRKVLAIPTTPMLGAHQAPEHKQQTLPPHACMKGQNVKGTLESPVPDAAPQSSLMTPPAPVLNWSTVSLVSSSLSDSPIVLREEELVPKGQEGESFGLRPKMDTIDLSAEWQREDPFSEVELCLLGDEEDVVTMNPAGNQDRVLDGGGRRGTERGGIVQGMGELSVDKDGQGCNGADGDVDGRLFGGSGTTSGLIMGTPSAIQVGCNPMVNNVELLGDASDLTWTQEWSPIEDFNDTFLHRTPSWQGQSCNDTASVSSMLVAGLTRGVCEGYEAAQQQADSGIGFDSFPNCVSKGGELQDSEVSQTKDRKASPLATLSLEEISSSDGEREADVDVRGWGKGAGRVVEGGNVSDSDSMMDAGLLFPADLEPLSLLGIEEGLEGNAGYWIGESGGGDGSNSLGPIPVEVWREDDVVGGGEGRVGTVEVGVDKFKKGERGIDGSEEELVGASPGGGSLLNIAKPSGPRGKTGFLEGLAASMSVVDTSPTFSAPSAAC